MARYFLLIVFLLYLTLPFIVHAQNNQSGFISIDCGFVDEPSYIDETTSIYYTWDFNFTDTGVSQSISSKHKTSLERQFWNVRSFQEGTRNCYTLYVSQGSNKKYLVRARFVYGNYDGKDSLPEFDIYLGAKWWESVVFDDSFSVITKEIIYASSSDYVHVCLLNTGKGTPFISVLEVRLLNSDAYLVNSLELLARFDVGSQGDQIIRYPDDIYDRTWTPYNSIDWKKIDTSLTIDQGAPSYNFLPLPPSTVMRTTSIPSNANDNIEFYFLPKYNASRYYVYLYFAEIMKLKENQIREFNIFVNGELLNSVPINPLYLQSLYYLSLISENKLEIWLNKTSRSTLPPLFNAIEIYMTKDFLQPETYQTDVDGILNVKSIYGIKRNWQGDPCTPVSYLWDGLNCSYVGSDSPRIIYLNLTSSGLIGNIAHGISNLKSIEYLDLSNNNLTGAVPDFLFQLQFLRVLNLEGNQLSGAIPIQLLVHSENSMLKSNFGGNPNLCSSGSCNKRNANKIVVPLVSSLGGAFMILAIAMVSFHVYYKRHRVSHQVSKVSGYSRIKQELETKKQEFSYEEVVSITRNFEKVLGKGASGTVYYGWIDHDTEVAVKVLSPSSAQGYLQFQAEAKLFAIVRHKYLTGLIGYCDDGTNMALIYEYMANGDLSKHLSDKNENILSWNQRLQIAVDAAEGLEYLHHGCNPPIVHRDIKSKNILLNEKMQAKLADFGLSKIFPNEGDTHVSTVVAGTPGYLDPEYNRLGKLKEKSDVFSFGVVLLEIITGQPAITKTEEKIHIIQLVGSMLLGKELKDIVDPTLEGDFDIYSAKKVLDIAMACVAPTSINRPTMSHVVIELKQCLQNMTHPSQSNYNHESLAMKTSCELAAKEGPYETYSGSPVSKGVLQPDMWHVTPSSLWDWDTLREMISKTGVRNSLLVAPMPTASTSQILGNNECFEPYTSNIYNRRVLSGEFVVVNKHLLHDLTEMGLWSPAIKNKIIYDNGSVENVAEIPAELKVIYKTVWEIKQKILVDMAVDRGCYIDQSQSLNIHMDKPNFGKLTSLHFYAWSKGLKTGMYYLRTRAASDAIKFTVDTTAIKEQQKAEEAEDDDTKMAQMVCSLTNRDECLACGS